MLGVVVATLVCAIFGSFLLVVTPILSDHEGLAHRLGALLGLPAEVPARRAAVVVHRAQQGVAGEAADLERPGDRATSSPTCSPRPTAPCCCPTPRRASTTCSGEAWNVADRVGGDRKLDAVDVALHIDELMGRLRSRRTPPRR